VDTGAFAVTSDLKLVITNLGNDLVTTHNAARLHFALPTFFKTHVTRDNYHALVRRGKK